MATNRMATWTRAVLAATTTALAVLGVAGGCAIGAPPGFSDGVSWSFPLVGPLEDGALVAPVLINGKGPYLFLIDPDSRESSVDAAIASELELYAVGGRELLDETDHLIKTPYVEVRTITVGDLTVSSREVRVHKVGTYAAGGRRMRGVLGADVIADSLVFGVDRDLGVGYLATQGHHTAPANAQTIGYTLLESREGGAPASRRLTKVRINDSFDAWMHIDLSGQTSQLRGSIIDAHKLPRIPARITIADELGTPRTIDHASVAASVAVGKVTRSGVFLLPYGDQRWRETDLDGTLGLNFFSIFDFTANWHTKTIYLSPRDLDPFKTVGQRLARWNSAVLDACPMPGCLVVSILDDSTGQEVPVVGPAPAVTAPAVPGADATAPGAGAPSADAAAAPLADAAAAPLIDAGATAAGALPVPAAPGALRMPSPPATYHVMLQRTAEAATSAVDVMLEAIDGKGERMALPRLLVSLPPDNASVMLEIDPQYAGTTLRVLDVNPFPRECASAGGCLWQLSDTL